jgi:branched-chain amino acid transport system permease protein
MLNRKAVFLLLCLAVLVVLPPVVEALDESYLISSMARILIFAIAAVSLDLIVGYGAMVSFGHAAFVGLGAYVAAIFGFHFFDSSSLLNLPIDYIGSNQLLVTIPAAMLVAALARLSLASARSARRR